jgi:hypothetical protein
VTDSRMTRFWITLPKGVQFVIDGMRMQGGARIFVPRIRYANPRPRRAICRQPPKVGSALASRANVPGRWLAPGSRSSTITSVMIDPL